MQANMIAVQATNLYKIKRSRYGIPSQNNQSKWMLPQVKDL